MDKELENSFKLALDSKLSELFSHNWVITVPEDLEDESEITDFVDEITHYDHEMWRQLKLYLRDNIKLPFVEDEDDKSICFSLPAAQEKIPFYKYLKIRFSFSHFSAEILSGEHDEFDFSELDGMSRDEAIDYLSSLPDEPFWDIPSFDYIRVSMQTDALGNSLCGALKPMVGSSELSQLVNDILNTVNGIPQIYRRVEEEFRLKEEQKHCEVRNLTTLSDTVRSVLSANGWGGEFCIVHFTSDLYKLYIRTSFASAYSLKGTVDEIIEKIPQLVQVANEYKALKKRLEKLNQSGYALGQETALKDMPWRKINK